MSISNTGNRFHGNGRIRKWLNKIAVFAVLLFGIILYTFAQEEPLRFRHITTEDGLSQNWVQCILRDSRGFMWFGTGGNGLNKYDGYSFKIYKSDPGNKNSLQNNWITVIFEDEDQNLFIGTQSGLCLYDKDKDNFYRIPGIQNQVVRGIFQYKEKVLCIICLQNIFFLNLNDFSIEPFCEGSQCFKGVFVSTIVKDRSGNYWVGSNDGLFRIDLQYKTFTCYLPEKSDPNSISDNDISVLYTDSRKRLWIGTTSNGLSLVNYKDDDPGKPYFINNLHEPNDPSSISGGRILVLRDDNKGKLWIGTENGGLDIIDQKDIDAGRFAFKHYTHNPYDETSISNNSIYSIFVDKQGTTWVGTYGGGINIYNKLLIKFNYYKQIPGMNNSLNNNLVNVFYQINTDLYIGTEGGLDIMNMVTGEFKHFTHDPNNPSSIGSDAVWEIFKDSRDRIWVGTWAGGLNLFHPESGTFTHYYTDPNKRNSISSNNIFGICGDDEGYLWIATMGGGLDRYDPIKNTFFTIQAEYKNPSSLSGDWVQTLFYNSKKELWVATTNGVDIYNIKNQSFTTFRTDTTNPASISSIGANILFEDSKGNMWIGSDIGLNRFVRKDSSFIHFQNVDGLPDNSIKGICEDNHGNLWLSTNFGLSKFINAVNLPARAEFVNYSTGDGLQGNEFNRRSCFKDQKGNLYFGGSNGFNVFYPDSIKPNPNIPRLYFTNLYIFNKRVEVDDKYGVLSQHISKCEKITLPYYYNVFTIEFAALNYIAPWKNQYKYILEGFEENWSEAGSKREVTYTNLDPGKYTFRVKASNNDGVWDEKGIALKITIPPPWWETWWFRVLSAIISIILLVGFYFYRLNALRKQKEQLQTKVIERTKEVEEKNKALTLQTELLNETNTLLEERQQRVEEQAEELRAQAEELANSNATLVTLNATKDKFFSIIAHDLKNPFSSILGFCEILILRYSKYDDNKRLQLIGVINQSAQHIFKLLENLLQWARSQTGSLKFEPEEFDVAELILENAGLLKNMLNEKQLLFESASTGKFMVVADKNMINTVIRNLISNAIKFTEKGTIRVRVKKEENALKVFVEDSGVGMTSERAQTLFEIGHSKSTEGTRGETGTGLGLIICKDFIEKNGGTIGVESIVGKGSTFYFTLPWNNSN
jgi:signal transduction histidine kinase/ligand-binding sensor domain-containing protein